jgi:hypothetical protein
MKLKHFMLYIEELERSKKRNGLLIYYRVRNWFHCFMSDTVEALVSMATSLLDVIEDFVSLVFVGFLIVLPVLIVWLGLLFIFNM